MPDMDICIIMYIVKRYLLLDNLLIIMLLLTAEAAFCFFVLLGASRYLFLAAAHEYSIPSPDHSQ
jgi:hypothetical protein